MASAWEHQRAHLEGLPVELLDWIAECLEPADVFTLRTVNRELCSSLSNAFVKKYFIRASYMIANEESMKTLLEVSAHPMYAKSLKEIRFSTATIMDVRDHYNFGEWIPEGGSEDDTHEEDLQISVKERNFAFSLTKLEMHQDLFRRDGNDVWYLTQALSNLAAAGNIPAIICQGLEVEGYDQPSKTQTQRRLPWGMERSRKRLEQLQRNCTHEPWTLQRRTTEPPPKYHPFQVICRAIVESDYPISHLQLGSERDGLPKYFFHTMSTSRSFHTLRQLFVTLAPYGVYPVTRVSRGLDENEDLEREIRRDAEDFVDFLRQAPNLEYLSLTISGIHAHVGFHDDTFEAMSKASSKGKLLPKLWGLELKRHFIEPDVLLRFVRNHRSTLRNLRLSCIEDEDEPHLGIEQAIIDASGRGDFFLRVGDSYGDDTWQEKGYWVESQLQFPPDELESYLRSSRALERIELNHETMYYNK